MADGTGLKQLTKDGVYKRLPRWSADGGRIAYLAKSNRALAQFKLIATSGDGLADFAIRPVESHTSGMRFVEDLEWLDDTHLVFWGSANPWNCDQAVLDIKTGKEVEWHFGTCRTFVRSPDGKLVAHWGPEGMGFSAEQRRESLEINGVDVYPAAINRKAATLQFLSNPAWSPASHQVALVDRDVNTGATSLTVLDVRPDQATGPVRRSFDYVARPARVLMHAPLASDLGDKMEVQWVNGSFVVSSEGGEALYQADAVRRAIAPAGADAIKSVAARRVQAAQLKSTLDDLMRKLGGKEPDIWTAPVSATQ